MEPSARLLAPLAVGVAMPAVVYAALVMLYLPDATAGQRVRAELILVVAHVASLAVLAAVFAAPQPELYFHAVRQIFVEIAGAPLMQLACAPLMAFPVWSVLSAPAVPRDPRAGADRRRDADAVPRTERGSRSPLPVERTTTDTTASTIEAPAVWEPDPREAPPANGATTNAAAAPTAPAVAAAIAEPVSDVITVPFARIAVELPADAFTCSVDALGEELSTPGYVTVPRALVVPQLAEGIVTVPWSEVAAQFPEPALAWSAERIVAHLVDGRLTLPLDEVVSQCRAEVMRDLRPPVDLTPLARFPEPFHALDADSARPTSSAAAPKPVILVAVDAMEAEPSLGDVEHSAIPTDGVVPAEPLDEPRVPSVPDEPAFETPGDDASVTAEPDDRFGDEPHEATASSDTECAIDARPAAPPCVADEAVAEAVRGLLRPWRAAAAFTCDAYAIAGRTIVTLVGDGHRASALAAIADRLAGIGAVTQVNVTHSDGAILVMCGDPACLDGAVVAASVDTRGSLALIDLLCRHVIDKCGATAPQPAAQTSGDAAPLARHRVTIGDGAIDVVAPADTDVDGAGDLARHLHAGVTALLESDDAVGHPDEVSARLLDGSWLSVRALDGRSGLLAVVAPASMPRGRARRVVERAARGA